MCLSRYREAFVYVMSSKSVFLFDVTHSVICSDFIIFTGKTLNVKTLTHELKDVTADWFELGVQLGVRHDKLHQIRQDCSGKTERCHTEMLNCWFQGDLEATWGKVVEALQRIDRLVLAQQLQRMYMHRSSDKGEVRAIYVRSKTDFPALIFGSPS